MRTLSCIWRFRSGDLIILLKTIIEIWKEPIKNPIDAKSQGKI